MLGRLLGDVLVEQSGPDLFSEVEAIRRACKRLRGNWTPQAAAQLRTRVAQLDLGQASAVARAFAIYFQLVNVAEQHHRVRRRREHELRPETEGPQEESFVQLVPEFRARGLSGERVAALVDALRVDLVSTAHPTENVRRTVLDKYVELHAALARTDREHLTPAERQDLEEALRSEITALWQTDELRSSPPTVIDEVKNNLFYFDDILFDALPGVAEDLQAELARVYPEAGIDVGEVVRFGTWVGGDRDGNPAVTAEVTREALILQKRLVLNKYLRAIQVVARKLSSSSTLQPPTPALRQSIAADEVAMPAFAAFMRDRNRYEPCRRKLFFVYRKLELALRAIGGRIEESSTGSAVVPTGDPGYQAATEFVADLEVIAAALEATRGGLLARRYLAPLIRRVRLFGFHLATMDIRAHSSTHTRAIDEVLGVAGVCPEYAKLGPEAQAALLARLLAPGGWRPGQVSPNQLTAASAEVLESFQVIAWAQQELGPRAIGPYIISMTHGVEDVLEVLFLAQDAGLCGWTGGRGSAYRSTLDIAPLVETIEDLRHGAEMLGTLLAHPAYQPQVAARGHFQEVMLGYSDSTKDGGYLSANWALHCAQRDMAAVAAAEGVELAYFHGRGGSLGRGGGPLGAAIRAQPVGTVRGKLRITQQGEVMSHRFLPLAIAERTLEQVLVAVLDAASRAETPTGKPQWHTAMEAMAGVAREEYRRLVEQPGFVSYFYAATPIDEIAMLHIGSRPSRRKPGQSLEDLRAIPWVFAWTQSRHLIPGWYGLGTGLAACGDWDMLREMYRDWPFFRTVIDNGAMALCKADMAIAAEYAALAAEAVPAAPDIFAQVREEYERTRTAVLAVQGNDRLLDDAPALQRTIELRNPYVDPLSYLQVALLRRLRQGGLNADERGNYLVAVLRTLNGIAHGLRNTG